MDGVFKTLVVVFIFFVTLSSIAQEAPKNQLGFWHENDFFMLTDRYYTFGLGIDYARNLEKGIFANTQERLRFKLYQQAYTPDNLRTTDLRQMERRYAGFLGFETHWGVVTKDLFEVQLLVGILGPASGSGGFQRWHHENIIKFVTPTWAAEIPNQFHSNITLLYRTEWQLSPNPFGIWVSPTPTVTLGSKDTFVEAGVEILFGRKSALAKSMRYGQFGDLEREIYFSFQYNYRWVSRNVLLEHDLFNFQQTPNTSVSLFDINFHHRYLKNEYRFGFKSISSEATRLNSHQFVTLSYTRGF